MIVKELYTGNGVSLSPKFEEGRILSDYVRLVADEEKAITDGTRIVTCVDVLSACASEWVEVTLEEAEALQKQWEEEIEIEE